MLSLQFNIYYSVAFIYRLDLINEFFFAEQYILF